MINELQQVLRHGGPVLWMLILLGIGLYTALASTWFGLLRLRKDVRQRFAEKSETPSNDDRREIVREFAVFELDRLAWVERRLPFIAVLAGAAPLAGLLGTVSGMLLTFSGLATSSAANPIDKISAGVSEALVTTQAGLLIAIPAAFLLAMLRRQTRSAQDTLQQQLHQRLALASAK